MNFHRPQAAQGIEDGNDGHAYVSKDGAPHIGDTYGGQSQHQKLDAQCKDNVLLDDTTGTPGNGYGQRQLAGIIVHKDYIRRFNGSIGAQSTHGHTYVCAGQHGGIVIPSPTYPTT